MMLNMRPVVGLLKQNFGSKIEFYSVDSVINDRINRTITKTYTRYTVDQAVVVPKTISQFGYKVAKSDEGFYTRIKIQGNSV